MAGKRCERAIQLLYSYDRLGDHKLSQIYRLLVPEKLWVLHRDEATLTETGEGTDEDGGAVCAGIVREAKRRANHR